MPNKNTPAIFFKTIYPRFRHFLLLGRRLYTLWIRLHTLISKRPTSSRAIPDAYAVCNTSTTNSNFDLICLDGEMPVDIRGSLFINQCLGTPEAYMVGDTNIIRLDFTNEEPHLTNHKMLTPAAVAQKGLQNTRHHFDFFGLMYLSPGLGMYAYTEGLYLMPDGRIAVTSDVDRPWLIHRDTLRPVTPVGRREEWMPMLGGQPGEILGKLFAGYSNSHVIYTDFEQAEVFLVNYRLRQADGSHPVKLIRWDGYGDFETWRVVDQEGREIEIKQSLHELVFTRDYILLADTAFVAGTEMFTPWVTASLPYENTVMYIVDRRNLNTDADTVIATRVEVEEPCIHLVPEYENPGDQITVYTLNTPATNTAEILRRSDRDLNGKLFPEHLIGYGTLPVLDLSSVGKHIIAAAGSFVKQSTYIRDEAYTWGPYLYAYPGRQLQPFNGQDLFVMFKGFKKDLIPQRIYDAYKDRKNRRIPVEDLFGETSIQQNNAICRISTNEFRIVDSFEFDDHTLLFTITLLESEVEQHPGYLIAAILTDHAAGDQSSGHEYWLFEAQDLAKGPICKLGHPSLNNITLFHTLFIPEKYTSQFDQNVISYHVPIREDYPEEELRTWDPHVLDIFKDVIWPYFGQTE